MGGGGGSAGKLDFPSYMKAYHEGALVGGGVFGPIAGTTMNDLMVTGLAGNPFTGVTAYDPDTDLAAMFTKATVFENAVLALSNGINISTLAANILSDDRINADVAAYSDLLDDQIEATVLPRFRSGMRDINAVMSSAFVIGEALIEEGRNHEVAKYQSGLRMKAFSDDAIRVLQLALDFDKSVALMYADLNRIKILTKQEEVDFNSDVSEADARWPFEVYLYGGQLLGIIGGGTFVPKGKSKSQSKLGGTMSGAASGAYVGSQVYPGVGTAVGAVIGGVAGYLAS